MTIEPIRELCAKINRSLFFVDGTLDYDELIDELSVLAYMVDDYDSEDTECLWSIGEHTGASLSDLIPGAYWHCTEWHSGQNSSSYACLSALGMVFNPGMASGPEPESSESDVYDALETMAQN
jgi:hypothetical protein